VWASALAAAVLAGETQAEELVEGDRAPRTPSATVRGSGAPGTPAPVVEVTSWRDEGATTVVTAGGFELVVVRVVGAGEVPMGVATLTGEWRGGGPAVLAGVAFTGEHGSSGDVS
jgi:hypothetical protein